MHMQGSVFNNWMNTKDKRQDLFLPEAWSLVRETDIQ